MMLAAPRLNGRIRSLTNKIVVPSNGGEFVWTTERQADADQGGNVHGALLDELHVHRSPRCSRRSRPAPDHGCSR
ncbi:MAG: hypothetical protein R2695_04080 [Acidimicrobiales bacterium]